MSTPRPARLSRREFVASTALAASAAWLASPRGLFAKEQSLVDVMRGGAAAATLTVEALRGGVHVILGSGGNIGVLAAPGGKLLVDAGLAGSQPKIADALAKLGAGPVKHLVNTHWHFDHCDGNEWLHGAGAVIMAHENTRKHLSEPTRVPDWDFTFPPVPKAALPTVIVNDEHALKLDGAAVAVRHYGFPCHTDGDLYVHFADADVLQTGDTFWNGHYPFIDTTTGGSIGGTIRAADSILKLAGEKTRIIPGHGSVGGRADLAEFRDMLAGVRDAVAKLKQAGKTVDEAVAAKPTAPWDKKYAGFVIPPDHFTRIAYAGV